MTPVSPTLPRLLDLKRIKAEYRLSYWQTYTLVARGDIRRFDRRRRAESSSTESTWRPGSNHGGSGRASGLDRVTVQ